MKFRLKTSGWRYNTGYHKKELEKLGFTFTKCKQKYKRGGELMINGKPTITIDSLEELMKFVHKWKSIVIDDKSIEIYDNYRE